MNIPANLKYSKTHEWVESTGPKTARIGLSDFAQSTLGDLVFVNLPAAGDAVIAGEAMGDIESVKAVSDIVSPLSGTVAAVNEELLDAPEKINADPYVAWLVEIEDINGSEELLSAEEYEAVCAEEA